MPYPVEWAEEAHLERRAARARHHARLGQTARALELYEALLPEADRLAPHRRLRLIGGYVEVLHRSEGVLAFERVRGLARQAETSYQRLSDRGDAKLVPARRHLARVQRALVTIAQGVGTRSGVGQLSLRQARDLQMVAGG